MISDLGVTEENKGRDCGLCQNFHQGVSAGAEVTGSAWLHTVTLWGKRPQWLQYHPCFWWSTIWYFMHRVISGFAFKMLFSLFSNGEDNHILNSDLQKADTHESIFMKVSTGTVSKFQDRQAGSNSLSFYPLTSVIDPSLHCTPGLLFQGCNTLHLSLLDFVMHSCSTCCCEVSYNWYLLNMILVVFIKTVKGLYKRNTDLKARKERTKYDIWRSPKMQLGYIQISWLNVLC